MIIYVSKWFCWICYEFPFEILMRFLWQQKSLRFGTWDNISVKLFFLIEPIGAIFMSCQIHFYMDTHPIKSYQCHFRRKIDYYFGHNANSCIFFSLLRYHNQVTTGHKLLKIGKNCQGHRERKYDHEEGSPLLCVHILNLCVF